MFAFIHPFNKYPVSSHVAIDSVLDAEHTGLKKKKNSFLHYPSLLQVADVTRQAYGHTSELRGTNSRTHPAIRTHTRQNSAHTEAAYQLSHTCVTLTLFV